MDLLRELSLLNGYEASATEIRGESKILVIVRPTSTADHHLTAVLVAE